MNAASTGHDHGVVAVPAQGLPAEPAEGHLLSGLAGDPRVDRLLIPPSRLQQRIAGLAAELDRVVPAAHPLHFLVVLKGALFFAKDLGEQLYRGHGRAVSYDFLKASTYGTEIKRAGETQREVRIEYEPDDLAGRELILVDDLVDQGFTLAAVRRYLLEDAGARSVRLCVLLDKELRAPSPTVTATRAQLDLDHVGFRVPDRWVAGYGIDAAEAFRNLPFIITVNEAYFRHER